MPTGVYIGQPAITIINSRLIADLKFLKYYQNDIISKRVILCFQDQIQQKLANEQICKAS